MSKKLDVFQSRRQYNKWVANETLEDFALRFTAKKSRRWSIARIANTALGTVSFLVLEALGGSITMNYGFINAFWAIVVVMLILFTSGIPVSYYAAKYGIDIDLLTRGAGFGYIGSTISSLIYASFTFIFFALEAVIMSRALEILFGIPLYIAYVISAIIIIPLVTHGISLIGRFQLWSQPIWLAMQFLPLFFVVQYNIDTFHEWVQFQGIAATSESAQTQQASQGFDILLFGASAAILFALMAQIGEQVDFLRFLPEPTKQTRKRWWAAVILAGPGWSIFGAMKLLIGSFLAFLLFKQGMVYIDVIDPTHMYTLAFGYLTHSPDIALIIAAIFVIISQVKINVANAYAGSLAWSNFFSRVTHHHPGRIVWVYFNVAIALLLMEVGLYAALERILHTYSALVLAWFGSVVADLIINKPLKLAPAGIEFKRSGLYDINPVGVGSMLLASVIGILSSFGFFGELAKAMSAFIAFLLPFITAPLIAWITKGKYYLIQAEAVQAETSSESVAEQQQCVLCQNYFDREDMSYCPAYSAPICSLCCALDSRCDDMCRSQGTLQYQFAYPIRKLIPAKIESKIPQPIMPFIFINLSIYIAMASIFALVIYKAIYFSETDSVTFTEVIISSYVESFLLMTIIIGLITWLYVLSRHNHKMVLKESQQQTHLLEGEIIAHRKTEEQLQLAKTIADDANTKKSRYVTALSHELRSPLNVVLGYAQLLEKDKNKLGVYTENIATIRRSAEQLESLVEGLLEISKIEAGKLELNNSNINLITFLDNLQQVFSEQAKAKNIEFNYTRGNNLPQYIYTDAQKLRQILTNLLSNALKFTNSGSVSFIITYKFQVTTFKVIDTGPGISAENQQYIFEPFHRITATSKTPGSGIGLTISHLLAETMGGSIEVDSQIGAGSCFTLKLLLSEEKSHQPVFDSDSFNTYYSISGYHGSTKYIVLVDDDTNHQQLIQQALRPLGFDIIKASSAEECLEIIDSCRIDLFLLDISLPGQDGWQLLQTLRDKGYLQAVIMISANAYAMQPDGSPANKALIEDVNFLTKPVHIDRLVNRIGALLDIEWIHQHQALEEKQDNTIKISSQKKEELIALLEIGHLTGFLQTLDELELNYGKQAILTALRDTANNFAFAQAINMLKNKDI